MNTAGPCRTTRRLNSDIGGPALHGIVQSAQCRSKMYLIMALLIRSLETGSDRETVRYSYCGTCGLPHAKTNACCRAGDLSCDVAPRIFQSSRPAQVDNDRLGKPFHPCSIKQLPNIVYPTHGLKIPRILDRCIVNATGLLL